MVRNYQKKTEMPANRDEQLEAAVKLVTDQNISIGKSAKEKGVPKETLRRWLKEQPTRSGSGSIKSVLTPKEEGDIVEAVIVSAKYSWPCGTSEIQLIVKDYLDGLGKTTAFKKMFPERIGS